jgi:hypothetical protein
MTSDNKTTASVVKAIKDGAHVTIHFALQLLAFKVLQLATRGCCLIITAWSTALRTASVLLVQVMVAILYTYMGLFVILLCVVGYVSVHAVNNESDILESGFEMTLYEERSNGQGRVDEYEDRTNGQTWKLQQKWEGTPDVEPDGGATNGDLAEFLRTRHARESIWRELRCEFGIDDDDDDGRTLRDEDSGQFGRKSGSFDVGCWAMVRGEKEDEFWNTEDTFN